MTIGARVRSLREKRGYTRSTLSQVAGINAVSLRVMECGHYRPSVPVVANLLRALRATEKEMYWVLDGGSPPRSALTADA